MKNVIVFVLAVASTTGFCITSINFVLAEASAGGFEGWITTLSQTDENTLENTADSLAQLKGQETSLLLPESLLKGSQNVSALQQNASAISTTISYNNPNLGFALQYPSEWQKQESLMLISPQTGPIDRGVESMDIRTEVLPTSDFALEQYTEAVLGGLSSQKNFNLTESTSTTIAGLPAHRIVYLLTTDDQIDKKIMQVWTVSNGIAYVITYGGLVDEFDESLSGAQDIIDSFRITTTGTRELEQ